MLVALVKDVFLSSGILSCVYTNLLGRVPALSPPFVAACGVHQRSRVANLGVKGMPSSVLGVQPFVSDPEYVMAAASCQFPGDCQILALRNRFSEILIMCLRVVFCDQLDVICVSTCDLTDTTTLKTC